LRQLAVLCISTLDKLQKLRYISFNKGGNTAALSFATTTVNHMPTRTAVSAREANQRIRQYRDYLTASPYDLYKLYFSNLYADGIIPAFNGIETGEFYHINCPEKAPAVCRPGYVYLNCTFIFNSAAVLKCYAKAIAFINCRFYVYNCLCNSKVLTYEPDYVINNPDTIMQLANRCYYSTTTYRHAEVGYLSYYDCAQQQNSKVVYFKDLLEFCVQLKYGKPDDSSTKINYNGTNYKFAKTGVVCGVEFELPVAAEHLELDKRLWHKDTDGSQITGDLEAVTRPVSVSYINSQKFANNVRKLWKQVKAPADLGAYIDLDKTQVPGKTAGSGIHVHFSWDKTLFPVEAERLIARCERLVADKGGEEWLLNVGGKAKFQLREYSGFPHRTSRGKYNFIHQINPHHVEFRFGATHPNPDVAVERVRTMVALFEQAFALEAVVVAKKLHKSTNYAILQMYLNKSK
jgi:hypothetical protein